MVATMLLLLAGGPVADAAVREPAAAASTSHPVTIASLPLRSIATGAERRCAAEPAEAPRPWTPERDVIGVASGDCWGQAITVTAPTRRVRPTAGPAYTAGDNPRMRAAMAVLPYLRGMVGGGAFAMALTGRLMLARGATPDLHFDVGRGRAGAVV